MIYAAIIISTGVIIAVQFWTTARYRSVYIQAAPSSQRTQPKSRESRNVRGALVTKLREALRTMPDEFTPNELVQAAKIETEKIPSAHAAISRMLLNTHEIERCESGNYQRSAGDRK